jgi:hypothetical protein
VVSSNPPPLRKSKRGSEREREKGWGKGKDRKKHKKGRRIAERTNGRRVSQSVSK